MRWTPEQQAAITHGAGLLAVVAGAGSGKTGVLTERFVHLVAERGVEPERILTITFTRAATAEMKTRILHKLAARGLPDARARLENAYIHTVHALCRRLLQENPFEAGVDPDLGVLPDPAANQLRRDAFHRALAQLLQTPRDFETDPLIDLIADYLNLDTTRGDPLQSLFAVVDRITNAVRHRGLTADDLRQWQHNYPDAPTLAWRYLLHAVAPLLPNPRPQATLAEPQSHSEREPKHKILDQRPWIDDQRHRIGNPRPWIDDQMPWIVDPMPLIDDPRHLIDNPRHLVGDQEISAEARRELRSLLDGFDATLEQHARAVSLALLELTIAYLDAYEALKQQRNALDFHDMQIRALQMLRDCATVRKRYQRQFLYTLVDETQDIDGLQAQIIDILAAGGNLMVVGDAQQSIYGFRHADPRVFERWQQRDGVRRVFLHTNFRSHPDILAFVACVFGHLWGERFQGLTPSRPPAPSPEEPRVQVWRLPRRDPHREATLIASQIRHWITQQSLRVHDPHTGTERPAQYGDFAVLFAQFTATAEFEQAFREVGVPYFVVGGGRGYWAQHEVRDLINLLHALCNAEDDLALACVLRSPLAGLSLDALIALTQHAQQTELPLRLCLHEETDLDPPDVERLRAFRQWFEPLSERVGEWSVGAILARALEASRYESKLLSQGETGRQAAANVRKLLAMALEQPHTPPRLFAQQLELTSRVAQREGNAPTYEETANVVRFYTVHSAKGLEFPVVFVADTAYRPRRDETRVQVDLDMGVVAVPVARPDHPTPYTPLPLRVLETQAQQRAEAEAQRTLYVALTRARDYLIVALTEAPNNPWARGLCGALAKYLDRNASTIPLPNGGMALLRRVG
ncbi:MAG: UvrD-helicase domain-containing protein [Fimbriimonadales bacterium]|nr:UvrD-helicase domain-containing protein [Fimbriimonadales bacterium]